MRQKRFIGPAAAIVLTIGAARTAVAQPTGTEVALAETLYRQARELMGQGKFDEACPKLAESYRLDRATGTLLNLASCHERQGKVATAWSEYADAAVAARRDGRTDRVKFADDRIHALEPQIPKLTLIVPTESDDPELELRLDGALIGVAARGVPTPVDPGKHVVEARAPNKKPWTREIEVKAAEQQTVTLGKLVDAPRAPAPADTATPVVVPPPRELLRDERQMGRSVPASVYVAGSATIALGVAAGITGVLYLKGNSELKSGENDQTKEAVKRLGYVNLGLYAATAGGAALTAILFFSRSDRPADRATARVAPFVGPSGGGLSLFGDF